MEKKCSKCHKSKKLEDYYADLRTKLGVQPCCKECFKDRAYKYRNSEQGRNIYKKYKSREVVKIKHRKKHREWQKSEEGKKYLKEYRQREKSKIYRRRYEKEYRKRSTAKQKDNLNCQRYRTIKISSSDGSVTYEKVKELLKKQNYRCALCQVDLRKIKKHLDHKIPISKQGVHTITNVQWLCYVCNIRKSNKI